MKGWAKKWRANGWRRSTNEPALNADLWQQLLDLCVYHAVTFIWVKGHAGNTENERCDLLSVRAAQGSELLVDEPYENKENASTPRRNATSTLFEK